MWMATREQVYHLDERCNSRFFNVNEETAVWVEVGLEGGREGGTGRRGGKDIVLVELVSHAPLHAHKYIHAND